MKGSNALFAEAFGTFWLVFCQSAFKVDPLIGA